MMLIGLLPDNFVSCFMICKGPWVGDIPQMQGWTQLLLILGPLYLEDILTIGLYPTHYIHLLFFEVEFSSPNI
jgi:hypothetical protein